MESGEFTYSATPAKLDPFPGAERPCLRIRESEVTSFKKYWAIYSHEPGTK